jgi:hypothetical protein
LKRKLAGAIAVSGFLWAWVVISPQVDMPESQRLTCVERIDSNHPSHRIGRRKGVDRHDVAVAGLKVRA